MDRFGGWLWLMLELTCDCRSVGLTLLGVGWFMENDPFVMQDDSASFFEKIKMFADAPIHHPNLGLRFLAVFPSGLWRPRPSYR